MQSPVYASSPPACLSLHFKRASSPGLALKRPCVSLFHYVFLCHAPQTSSQETEGDQEAEKKAPPSGESQNNGSSDTRRDSFQHCIGRGAAVFSISTPPRNDVVNSLRSPQGHHPGGLPAATRPRRLHLSEVDDASQLPRRGLQSGGTRLRLGLAQMLHGLHVRLCQARGYSGHPRSPRLRVDRHGKVDGPCHVRPQRFPGCI